MISIRDEEVCELLVNKDIDINNIKNAIDYYISESEPVNMVYKNCPILDSFFKTLLNLIFLLLGVVIPVMAREIKSEVGMLKYEIIFTTLIVLIIIFVILKIYNYYDMKDIYRYKLRKLVAELKQIYLLNKFE